MPNKSAAIKALRQTKKHAIRNRKVMANVEIAVRAARRAAAAKASDYMDKIKLAVKALDKASQKGVIKRNTAARKKSRLIKMANKAMA
ncbi:MAG: 30S ribosomal protein S20 [Patescibacteria group bacterium]